MVLLISFLVCQEIQVILFIPKTDNSGDLTLTDTGVAIFLKLTNAVPSVSRGTVTNGTSSARR